jgi:hypothetical protein
MKTTLVRSQLALHFEIGARIDDAQRTVARIGGDEA